MSGIGRLKAAEIVECAEWVLPGHPDKLCDAAADNVVAFITPLGANGQCGVELACVFDRVVITGRVASNHKYATRALRDYQVHNMIRDAYATAGYGEDAAGHVWGPRPDDLKIDVHARIGCFDDGEGELRHLSDDQAICVGYANSLGECDGLPPAHWLARGIARTLFELRREKGAGQVGPDGKVLVRIARKGRAWRPLSVSISLHHHEASDWVFLNAFAAEAVETARAGRATPDITLNGAGMFVCGGPNGDNGQTGKKLVMDAYGPSVPLGGGAWSGKDFWKVDRRGGLLARAMAQRLVQERGCEEARVTLEYYPGSDAPAYGEAIVDGRRVDLDCRALTAAVVVPKLKAMFTPPKSSGREFDLQEAARWGHHAHLGHLWRELPEFEVRSAATVKIILGKRELRRCREAPVRSPEQWGNVSMPVQHAQDFDAVRALDIEHQERVAPCRQRSQVGNFEFNSVPWRFNSGKASNLSKRRFEGVDERPSDNVVAVVQVVIDGVADIVMSALTQENALHVNGGTRSSGCPLLHGCAVRRSMCCRPRR